MLPSQSSLSLARLKYVRIIRIGRHRHTLNGDIFYENPGLCLTSRLGVRAFELVYTSGIIDRSTVPCICNTAATQSSSIYKVRYIRHALPWTGCETTSRCS
jgi:hypothetical protein